MTPERFASLWRSLEPIGRDPSTDGYLRYAWSEADLACREWFVEEALDRSLTVETDRNGNLWAWWGASDAGDAVVTGSHFDSVPHGGGYDGPLGIVSGFLALDLLRERGASPLRPIGVAAFVEVDPRKIGQRIHGTRVVDVASAAAFAGELHLAAVGRPGARARIRSAARRLGLEGERLVAVA